METKEQIYYGKIVNIDEVAKYIECNILHFDTANENRWRALTGSLDAFLVRMEKAKKFVTACYQHEESIVIGLWKELTITGNVLSGKLFYVETQFVKDTVLPLLKAGALQGASPSIAPIRDSYNQDLGLWEILEGALCEISLVGLPADLKADILTIQASIQAKNKSDFEFDLLTL